MACLSGKAEAKRPVERPFMSADSILVRAGNERQERTNRFAS